MRILKDDFVSLHGNNSKFIMNFLLYSYEILAIEENMDFAQSP